jgi:hypothetical protein
LRYNRRRRQIANALVRELDEEIDRKGYAYVGGRITSARLGVSPTLFNAVVRSLEAEGKYVVLSLRNYELKTKTHGRTIKLLAPKGTTREQALSDREKILGLVEYEPDLAEILSLQESPFRTRQLYRYFKKYVRKSWNDQTVGERRILSVLVSETMKLELKTHRIIDISRGSEANYGVDRNHIGDAVKTLTRPHSGYRRKTFVSENSGPRQVLVMDDVSPEELDRYKRKFRGQL